MNSRSNWTENKNLRKKQNISNFEREKKCGSSNDMIEQFESK